MTSPVRAPRPTPRSHPASPAPSYRPDLRVVRAPARRARTGVWFALSVVLVFGALFVAAMAHSMLVSGQSHLDEVNGEIRTEKQALQREQLRLAELQSPVRIAEAAEDQGMVDGGPSPWIAPESHGSSSADDSTSTGTDADPDGTTTPAGTGDQLASATDEGTAGQR
ncbi:hypothetical protein KSP35_05575 [Aquihabitans sp. G128]|uniref:hypothetical protein n=1 Tax=Aquihabitans sp. G128 TaxID=2849779 RepID=UPI001C2125A0|nr:hypothetical protein [Aquihabitans sp. G128]QXC62276.1 hypothetical protein KSP35_05575 [Aquihabitans sp. G128]